MSTQTFRARMQAGDHLVGLAHTYASSGSIEAFAPGWDFLWIDGQHGQFDYVDLLRAVQVTHGACVESLLRIPDQSLVTVGRHADLGPSALLVPLVDTEAQAREVLRALRYPPQGDRSFTSPRLLSEYGAEGILDPDQCPVVVAQIETVEAVGNARDIAAVEGVDALFVGPADLRLSLGLPMSTPLTASGALREALAAVVEAANHAGKPTAIPVADSAGLEMALDLGYRMIVYGSDGQFLRTLSRERRDELRRVLANR